MKVILTITIDDEKLKEEGVDPDAMLKQFTELKEELSYDAPPGVKITMRLEL